jgi:hypothetical protein
MRTYVNPTSCSSLIWRSNPSKATACPAIRETSFQHLQIRARKRHQSKRTCFDYDPETNAGAVDGGADVQTASATNAGGRIVGCATASVATVVAPPMQADVQTAFRFIIKAIRPFYQRS